MTFASRGSAAAHTITGVYSPANAEMNPFYFAVLGVPTSYQFSRTLAAPATFKWSNILAHRPLL